MEDWSQLVAEYDNYLARELTFGEPEITLSYESKEDLAILLQTISNLNTTIGNLRAELKACDGFCPHTGTKA